jgi:hypothetical protein
MTEAEHEGWRDLSDRDMLSYACNVLSKLESTLDHSTVEWAETATAVGHLGRRLQAPTARSSAAARIDEVMGDSASR